MDVPAAHFCMLDNFTKKIKGKYSQNRILLDLGSCGLHNVHSSYKTGMKKTEWKISNLLNCLYRLFKNVPLRRGIYSKIKKYDIFPL